MYQAPDFVKIEIKVRNSLTASGSCVYDEGTNYTISSESICMGSDTSGLHHATYIELLPESTWQCYSTLDEP